MYGIICRVPRQNLRDTIRWLDPTAIRTSSHIEKGHHVQELRIGQSELSKLDPQAALLCFSLSPSMKSDQRHYGGRVTVGPHPMRPIQRMKTRRTDLLGVTDVMQPGRTDHILDPDGQRLRHRANRADMVPSLAKPS